MHRNRGIDRLAQAAPNSAALLTRAAERGENLGSITAALLYQAIGPQLSCILVNNGLLRKQLFGTNR